MHNCIFCSIAEGQTPSFKVYEDADVLAFMDIHPINPGHVLVIPKVHEEHFHDLEDELFSKVMRIGKKIAATLQPLYTPKKVGFAVAGFDVPHAHLHVIPIHEYHDLTSRHYLENTLKQSTPEDLLSHSNRIKDHLQQ